MIERLIPRARPDDDSLGADKRPSEGGEGNEEIRYIQPKAQDALEVERLGLMKVPRRFTFEEAKKALASGVMIIARSEHPDEAKGLSGVNPSFTFDNDDPITSTSEEKFRLAMIETGQYDGSAHKFCEINGVDKEKYDREISWSFWEKIPGVNVSIVQDNTVPNRFWILANWEYAEPDAGYKSGVRHSTVGQTFLVENGLLSPQIENMRDEYSVPEYFASSISAMINAYDKVKDHFGRDTAWITEMQVAETGEIYFLQRHPSRKMETNSWTFDGPADPDEIVVRCSAESAVRGATPKEGWEVDMLYDGRGMTADIPQQEAYNKITVQNPVEYQKWVANAKLFLNTSGFTDSAFAQNPHSGIIPLTKPSVYIATESFRNELDRKWREKEREVRAEKRKARTKKIKELGTAKSEGRLNQQQYEEQYNAYVYTPENLLKVKMRVRSDGTEARIKILDVH